MIGNHHKATPASQSGFTLIELMIVVVILGVVAVATTMATNGAFEMYRWAWSERQQDNNARIASAHMEYAFQYGEGRLLSPATYDEFKSSPVHLTATGDWQRFREILQSENILPEQAAHDLSAARRVRVYQTYEQTQDIPMSGFTGETVRINYDVAVIYQTRCSADAACNSGLPGDSAAINSGNASTWDVEGEDESPVHFSSQSVQRRMWSITDQRIQRLIRELVDLKNNAILTAPASEAANNHLPKPTDGTPDLSGSSPGGNQDCYDGWYDLSATNILDRAGLSRTQYSQTAWGGLIEYCANFDPAHNGENEGPFNGALRIHFHVSEGLNPSSNINENRFYTF